MSWLRTNSRWDWEYFPSKPYRAKFHTPPPPTLQKTLLGVGGCIREAGRITFLPRGASKSMFEASERLHESCLWSLKNFASSRLLGNRRNTVSRVMLRRRELTEPHWVLGQTGWALRKTRWVRFGTQIIGWEELTEFAPRNSMSPKNSLSSAFETVLSETVFGPFPNYWSPDTQSRWCTNRSRTGKRSRRNCQGTESRTRTIRTAFWGIQKGTGTMPLL